MLKINIIGTILGMTGYDSHTRSLASALYKIADCRLTTQLPQDWMQRVNDAELDMLTKPDRKEDYNLIISMPHTWKLFTGLGKNIGYCVWEGDKVPISWIDDFLNPKIDLIFVPSKHTLSAILLTCELYGGDASTIVQNKIKIIPHGVDRKLFYSQRKKVGDDAQNVPRLESRSEAGEDDKVEQMPVVADTHSDTLL